MNPAPAIVNIAAYQFAELTGLAALRAELRILCTALHLRGTILLSPEGINVFTAGQRGAIDQLLLRLRQIPGLAGLQVKESYSDTQPFSRMLVKIKQEIIAFGVEGIDPRRYTSRKLPPAELKRWLDEGKPVTLLDTRNTFEVQAGTFDNAVAIDLDDFRNFPTAIANLPAELKNQPIVTFCTGGIRCEKAAPFLEKQGFSNVYQLDGGILKYFEDCGGAHYRGQCFVFDRRVALQPNLQPGNLKQCYACQAVLSLEDQASAFYVEGLSCPHCHRSDQQRQRDLLSDRNAALAQLATSLPGSTPYDNIRPISVPLRLDGTELIEFLVAMRTHLSADDWIAACKEGRLTCCGLVAKPGRTVRSGERFLHRIPATREPDVSGHIQVLFEDDALVVINKPAPLPMHPCGRFHRNTLSYLLEQVYHPTPLRPIHRLDADTTGVVIFAKSREITRTLQQQFQAGAVTKSYLAVVHGRPDADAFECHLPISPSPHSAASGQHGVRLPDPAGTPASTRFRVLRRLGNERTLIEATPLTGRTNQIRLHLWALGLPIVGDPIYLPNGTTAAPKALSITDPPLHLHASGLSLTHPLTRQPATFTAPPPTFFA